MRQIQRLLLQWTELPVERVALGRLGDSRSEADLVAQVGRVILVFEYKGLADAAVVHSAINAAKVHASAVSKKAIPVDASDDYDSVFCLRATSLFALQVFRGQETLRRVAVSNDALRPYTPPLPRVFAPEDIRFASSRDRRSARQLGARRSSWYVETMTSDPGVPRCFDRTNAVDWKRAHAELERLARERARLEAEEGPWLLCALRTRAHVELGYGSFAEYVERLFGYDARSVREKLRVAEALEHLPELSRALCGGELCWSAVRELTRVAAAETEAEWLEAARGKTSRELERQVSGRKPGDRPTDPAQASAMRHVLRFEVSPETLAALREALSKLRRDSGSPLDEDAALLLMARHVLGGPTDEGRASYQMLLTVCERCGRAEQQARGQLVEVGPDVVAMARCDGQSLRAADLESESDPRGEPRSEPHAGHGHESRMSPAHDTHAGHGGEPRMSPAGDTHVGHGVAMRARPDTGVSAHGGRDVAARSPRSLPHATQEVPPAVRRWVMRRDRGCCVVPGCSNAVFVDIHHLDPRSEGGDHNPETMAVLCAAHHRAVHRGQLVVEGRVSAGLVFRHADGRAYGRPVCAAAAQAWTKAFGALRAMGFSETQTLRALERTRSMADAAGEPPGVEQVLRLALAVLTEGRAGDRPARAWRTQAHP